MQNGSAGEGKRVIHVFASAQRDPAAAVERGRELAAIANGYCTAMQA